MSKILLSLLVLVGLVLTGCGGGGGGGGTGQTVQVTGYVLSVETGGAMSPAPTVRIGSASVQASADDGSFSIEAPVGATEVVVTTGEFGTFRFPVPTITEAKDLGIFWVGPETVDVRGTVLSSSDSTPVAGAVVSFGGKTATTNAQGIFLIQGVAYAQGGAFGSIEGKVTAQGFFEGSFNAQGMNPSGGAVNVGQVLITPTGDENPPPGPYNIWGRVSPTSEAPGTVVTLKQGGTAVRQTTVGSDGRYYFWVPAGTYELTFVKGALGATANVTLVSSDQVVQKDVTLSS